MSNTLALDDQLGSTETYRPTATETSYIPSHQNFRHHAAEYGKSKPAKSLSAAFGINAENLAARRAFIRLSGDEARVMADLIPWARSMAKQIAIEFYDWQFNFPATVKFFDNFAKRHGLTMASLRERLERAQQGYFLGLCEGATSEWGLEYFE